MTPRKNPYTLKGFMNILQGNSNNSQKQESKKPKELKKDQNKK